MPRVSAKEALKRGWINEETARELGVTAKKAGKNSEESPLEKKLNDSLMAIYPGRFVRQHKFHKERKFALDFAFLDEKVAIEVDGYRHHGLSISGFKRDRVKRNLLAEEGWMVLSFYAAQINNEMGYVLYTIAKALDKKKPA